MGQSLPEDESTMSPCRAYCLHSVCPPIISLQFSRGSEVCPSSSICARVLGQTCT